MLKVSVNLEQGVYIIRGDDGQQAIMIPMDGNYDRENIKTTRKEIEESRKNTSKWIPSEKLKLIDSGVYKALCEFDRKNETDYANKYIDVTTKQIPTNTAEKKRDFKNRVIQEQSEAFKANGISVEYNLSLFSGNKRIGLGERIRAIRQAFAQKQNGIKVQFANNKQRLLDAGPEMREIPEIPVDTRIPDTTVTNSITVADPKISVGQAVPTPSASSAIPRIPTPPVSPAIPTAPTSSANSFDQGNQEPIVFGDEASHLSVEQILGITPKVQKAPITNPIISGAMKGSEKIEPQQETTKQLEKVKPQPVPKAKKEISRSKAIQASKKLSREENRKAYRAKLIEKANERKAAKLAGELANPNKLSPKPNPVVKKDPPTIPPTTNPVTKKDPPTIPPKPDPVVKKDPQTIARKPIIRTGRGIKYQKIGVRTKFIGKIKDKAQALPSIPNPIIPIKQVGAKIQEGINVARFTGNIKEKAEKIKNAKPLSKLTPKQRTIVGAVSLFAAVSLTTAVASYATHSAIEYLQQYSRNNEPATPEIVEMVTPQLNSEKRLENLYEVNGQKEQTAVETPNVQKIEEHSQENQVSDNQDIVTDKETKQNETSLTEAEKQESRKQYLSSIKIGSIMNINRGKFFETPEGKGRYGNLERYTDGVKEISLIDVMTDSGYIQIKDSNVNLYQLKQQYPNAKFSYHIVCRNADGTKTTLGWLTEDSIKQDKETNQIVIDDIDDMDM